MKRYLALTLVCACEAGNHKAITADSAAVAARVHHRLEAALAGDTARWHQLVSDSALWVGPSLKPTSTKVVLPIIAANRLLKPGAQAIRDLEVHIYGPVALATYLQLVAGPDGAERTGKRFRKSDTFRWEKGGWLLIGATEIAIPYRESMRLDEQRAHAITGRYGLEGVDSIDIASTVTGFRLTSLDGSVVDLLAADDSTLFEEGDPGDWIVRTATKGVEPALIYRMQGAADVVLKRVQGN